MKRKDALMCLDSLKKDIGQPQYQALWHYAEAIDEIIEALQADAVQKLRDMPRYLNGIKANQIKKMPSEAEQVTGKLNNPDDSLLTADSEACKEQKSKLGLISRQAVIELIKNSYYNLAENMDDVWAMVHDVEQLPSAPDSRQRGEWVRKYDGHINCYWYECDQCGEYRPRNQFGHEYNANFCPNCGADMRGGEDDDE